MKFTDEQAQAVFTHDRNLIVTAGAGSGKTRVLVERYLALLDGNPDWTISDLVAITFTEKAAREMRDRVRSTVQARLSSGKDAARWRQHEAKLDSARIGTIHALCADILRANPAQVPVDPAFEVLDESEASLLKQDAVEQALIKLVDEDAPAAVLLLTYGVNTVRRTLYSFTDRSAAQELIANIPDDPAALMDRWQGLFDAALQDVMARTRADAVLLENLRWQPPHGWASDDDKLMANWRIIRDVEGDLLQGDADAFVAALDQLDGIDVRGGKASEWGSKDAVSEVKAVLTGIRDIVRGTIKMLPQPLTDSDHDAAALLVFWKDAVRRVLAEYNTLKDQRAALDFDDLETRTVALLNDHPNVAARYSAGEFRQLMVDELDRKSVV
jgi:ATP-dependent helicase/nuclease subunit A